MTTLLMPLLENEQIMKTLLECFIELGGRLSLNQKITPLHFLELIAFNSKSIATLSQFYVEVQCQWCKGNEKFLFTFFPTEQPLPIVKTTSLEQDGDHPLTSLDFCDISIKPIVFSTKIFNRVDHSIYIRTVSSQHLLSNLLTQFKLIHRLFGQSNIHSSLDFCPKSAKG